MSLGSGGLGGGWGLKPPTENPPAVSWGARAIYNGSTVDLLWDRQSAEGSEEHREALSYWLDTYALPELREDVRKRFLAGNSDETRVIRSHGFECHYSPRCSHGYLYIGAWSSVPAAEVVKPPARVLWTSPNGQWVVEHVPERDAVNLVSWAEGGAKGRRMLVTREWGGELNYLECVAAVVNVPVYVKRKLDTLVGGKPELKKTKKLKRTLPRRAAGSRY